MFVCRPLAEAASCSATLRGEALRVEYLRFVAGALARGVWLRAMRCLDDEDGLSPLRQDLVETAGCSASLPVLAVLCSNAENLLSMFPQGSGLLVLSEVHPGAFEAASCGASLRSMACLTPNQCIAAIVTSAARWHHCRLSLVLYHKRFFLSARNSRTTNLGTFWSSAMNSPWDSFSLVL